jgi:phosphate uptake regulator
MLRELLSLFRSENPLSAMAENFAEMLTLTFELTVEAGDIYFGKPVTPEERTALYERDVQVNKLERTIRKQVIAHLSLGANSSDLPYCLLLMSLVKDVERIGDYAKNLTEVPELHRDPLPDDELAAELREIRTGIEAAFTVTAEVFATSDRERAVGLIRQGRDITHRCDVLLKDIAQSDHPAGPTAALVLGARYYKRIAGHVLNVLSSIVMPLHKLDYYDENELPPGGGT